MKLNIFEIERNADFLSISISISKNQNIEEKCELLLKYVRAEIQDVQVPKLNSSEDALSRRRQRLWKSSWNATG